MRWCFDDWPDERVLVLQLELELLPLSFSPFILKTYLRTLHSPSVALCSFSPTLFSLTLLSLIMHFSTALIAAVVGFSSLVAAAAPGESHPCKHHSAGNGADIILTLCSSPSRARSRTRLWPQADQQARDHGAHQPQEREPRQASASLRPPGLPCRPEPLRLREFPRCLLPLRGWG